MIMISFLLYNGMSINVLSMMARSKHLKNENYFPVRHVQKKKRKRRSINIHYHRHSLDNALCLFLKRDTARGQKQEEGKILMRKTSRLCAAAEIERIF